MVKTIKFSIDTDVYFRILELRAKMHSKGWEEFMLKILDHFDNE